MSDDRRGQRVGDYVLERKLGRGGMSVVWFARERATGRPAAVKILNANLPKNIDAERRLTQEARAIQRIDHPNVVKVHAWGLTPDNRPYIAMEHLEGRPLGAVSGRGKVLPVELACRITRQMLSALDKAHTLDIIHRDLKPDNVLLITRDGDEHFVKMLDFGIAKLLGAQPHTAVQTARGVVLGTPEYLPPEIALDQGVSPATDLYSVGVMLFEALTGRLPFVARGAMALAEAHCFSPPPRPRTYNPELPPALEAVVLRCLEKRPDQRYDRAAALADALLPFVDDGEAPTPTLVNPPLSVMTGLAQASAHAEDARVGAAEVFLRDEIRARWADHPLPAHLARSVTKLDAAREALDAVDAELALIETHDLMPDPLAATFAQAVAGEAQARADHEALCARDLALSTKLSTLDDGLAERICGLLSEDHIDRCVLEVPVLSALGDRLGRSSEIAALERTRQALLAEIEVAADHLAQMITERARLEADRTLAAAISDAARIRRRGRARDLTARHEAHQRELSEALTQCAIDHALAMGTR